MYTPSSFREDRIDAIHGLIRAHPLGTLVTHGPHGLVASPMVFLLYADEGQKGTLRTHIARANPHWHELRDATECLVVFQGAGGYVTPSWYPSKSRTHEVVPTWNYATVHVRGRPTVFEEEGWLRRQLQDLTGLHEGVRPRPWAMDDAPNDYIAAQLKAIIGIEIPVDRIEGKWKMSQNKQDADRMGVVDGLRAENDPHRNAAVADLVEGTRER